MLDQTDTATFRVRQIPTEAFAGLTGGTVAVDWPFGDGRLCVNPAFGWWRLPGAQSEASGSVSFAADAFLAPGQTMYVQSWYRDSGNGGFGFNLTNRVVWDQE